VGDPVWNSALNMPRGNRVSSREGRARITTLKIRNGEIRQRTNELAKSEEEGKNHPSQSETQRKENRPRPNRRVQTRSWKGEKRTSDGRSLKKQKTLHERKKFGAWPKKDHHLPQGGGRRNIEARDSEAKGSF